jgi:small subunit ribosomal protein S17
MILNRKKRKCRFGVVIKNNSNKTRIVSIDRTYRHKLYNRVIHNSKNFIVHDEKNISNIGDNVEIMETRPLSKTKNWIIIKVL